MTAPGEAGSQDPLHSWVEYTELATTAPGIDPLEAMMGPEPESVPERGFLITAALRPGLADGAIRAQSYTMIDFDPVQEMPQHGVRRAGYWITGKYTSVNVSVGDDDHPRTPHNVATPEALRYDENWPLGEPQTAQLSSGKPITATLSGGESVVLTYRTLESYDPLADEFVGEHPEQDTQVVRTVATVEEAAEVLLVLGRSLGLRHDDHRTFADLTLQRLGEIVPDETMRARLAEIVASPDGTTWLQRIGALAALPRG